MPTRKLTELFLQNVKPTAGAAQTDYVDSDTPGLVLRVFSTGRRTWMIHYRHAGKFRKLAIGYPGAGAGTMSLLEARKVARDHRDQIHAGIDPAIKRPDKSKPKTFTALAAVYMRKHARRRKRSAPEDLRMLQSYCKPALGDKAPDQITKGDCLEVIEAIAARGALAQADAVLALLKTLFRWAVDEDLAAHNPTVGIRKRRQPVARDRALSRDELAAVWKALPALPLDAAVRTVLQVLALTGQRASEVIEMERDELRLDEPEPTWIIPARRSKNKREHTLPLAPATAERLRAACAASRSDRYVFPTQLAGRDEPLTEGIARRALHRATAAGLFSVNGKPVAPFGPHDLRRTMATRLDEDLEIDEAVIGRLLNHTRGGVTAKHYNKARKLKHMREAAERWATYLHAL